MCFCLLMQIKLFVITVVFDTGTSTSGRRTVVQYMKMPVLQRGQSVQQLHRLCRTGRRNIKREKSCCESFPAEFSPPQKLFWKCRNSSPSILSFQSWYNNASWLQRQAPCRRAEDGSCPKGTAPKGTRWVQHAEPPGLLVTVALSESRVLGSSESAFGA